MNRCNRIEDRVIIGAGGDAMDPGTVERFGVTAILCVARGYYPERVQPAPVIHSHLTDMARGTRRNSDAEMRSAVDHFERLHANGHCVLVHCHAGYSRSPSVVIGWLLKTGRYRTVDDALKYIRAHHNCRPGRLMLDHLRTLYESTQHLP